MKIKLSAMVCLLLLASAAPAQELAKISDAFSWIPDGAYDQFGMLDQAALQQAEAKDVFYQIFSMDDDSLFGSPLPLDASVIKRASYICVAHALNLTRLTELAELQAAAGRSGKEVDEELERRWERFEEGRRTDTLYTIYSPETDLIVDDLLKNGTIARLGKRVLKRPIYTISADRKLRGQNSEKGGPFLWTSATGEMLIAGELGTLRQMIAAGAEGGLRMIDNQEYAAAFSYVTDLGQAWNIDASRLGHEKIIRMMEDRGENADELRPLIDPRGQRKVYDIDEFRVSDIIVVRSSEVYEDEDVAEKVFNQRNSSLKQAADQLKGQEKEMAAELEDSELNARQARMASQAMGFASELLESQDTFLEGTSVVTSITFGQKQLRTLSNLLKFAKAVEERQQQKSSSPDK